MLLQLSQKREIDVETYGSYFFSIDTVGVLTSTGDFQNFGLLEQVKLVYSRDQQANLIILSHQARKEQLDSWQLGAKKMEK